jgi:hypothetical protein
MWQTLMDLLPDLRAGYFEIRDILSLGTAGLGSYLAWLAIRVGRAQKQMGLEQIEIAKRQEALDIKAMQIAERQAAIVEKQNQIFEDQLGRKAELEVVIEHSRIVGTQKVYALAIQNSGKRKAHGFYWSVYIPAEALPFIAMEFGSASPQRCCTLRTHEGKQYSFCTWYETGVVFSGQKTGFGQITIVTAKPDTFFKMGWAVTCDDGDFPRPGQVGHVEVPLH